MADKTAWHATDEDDDEDERNGLDLSGAERRAVKRAG